MTVVSIDAISAGIGKIVEWSPVERFYNFDTGLLVGQFKDRWLLAIKKRLIVTMVVTLITDLFTSCLAQCQSVCSSFFWRTRNTTEKFSAIWVLAKNTDIRKHIVYLNTNIFQKFPKIEIISITQNLPYRGSNMNPVDGVVKNANFTINARW